MGATTSRRTRLKRVALVLAALVVVGLIAASNAFGRALPTANYRPELPPDALSTGCWPLPGGASLADLPHQVRSDGDVDGRRRLVLQYDLVDAATARDRVTQAFVAVGFTRESDAGSDVVLAAPGSGPTDDIDIAVTPLTGLPPGSLVRGTVVLDLPSTPLASGDPICGEPYATKRFAGAG